MKHSDGGIGSRIRSRWYALLGLGALAVLAVALSACGSGNSSGSASASGTGTQTQGAENVKLVIKSDEEKAKKGPEGKWHDAFLPADFSVKAGATVKVTVYNYDERPHSFTAAQLGTNATIAAGTEEQAEQDHLHLPGAPEGGQLRMVLRDALRPVGDEPRRVHEGARDRHLKPHHTTGRKRLLHHSRPRERPAVVRLAAVTDRTGKQSQGRAVEAAAATTSTHSRVATLRCATTNPGCSPNQTFIAPSRT